MIAFDLNGIRILMTEWICASLHAVDQRHVERREKSGCAFGVLFAFLKKKWCHSRATDVAQGLLASRCFLELEEYLGVRARHHVWRLRRRRCV